MEENAERVACEGYKYNHKRFVLRDMKFNQQFASLYTMRLNELRQRVMRSVKRKWGEDVKLSRVVNLVQGEDCACIGALYKNMKCKPNFLIQYAREMGEDETLNFEEDDCITKCSPDDTLSLEDSSGRTNLEGNVPTGMLTTGMVVAVFGALKGKVFEVADWTFAPLPQQTPLPSSLPGQSISFLSGLDFPHSSEGESTDMRVHRDAVSNFLRGNLGCVDIVRKISKVILAGGLMSQTPDLRMADKIKLEMNDHQQIQEAELVGPMKEVDDYLTVLSGSVPVDVMPSRSDPTSTLLPYQPIHPCLLRMSCDGGNTVPVTSPFEFTLQNDTITALGTSGENLQELCDQTTLDSLCDMLELLVKCNHLVPTAPDTLPCYSYKDVDPFILNTTPHIFFAGNAPKFETRYFKSTCEVSGDEVACRLIAIPKFETQPGVVIVDVSQQDFPYVAI
eukprot:TRINITY_DN10452_c0_g1_i2.p1 TRINITY_DN10452_c0_g1~~TRINITY_DN10452_c0_g1_i2.p1  ORF type:complete len:459 (+),score=98.86 TRINITY_DN10452_c0_g1_i2:31-1377(+)